MLSITDILQQYVGERPILYMLIGLAVLILVNLVLSIVQAHKDPNDNIDFELLPDFIQPLLLYGVFLLCTEAMVIATANIPAVSAAATGFQIFVFVTILLKYFKQVYSKLKALGMETDPDLDKKVEDLTGSTIKIDASKIVSVPVQGSKIDAAVTMIDKIKAGEQTSEYVAGRPEEDNR